MNYIIPKNLTVYSVKKDCLKNEPPYSAEGIELISIAPDATKSSLGRAVRSFRNFGIYLGDSDLIHTGNIPNSNLTIRIPEEEIVLGSSGYYNSLCAEVSSPSLSEGKRYILILDRETFLQAIVESNNIIDRALPGKFCIEFCKEGSNTTIKIHKDDRTDPELTEGKKLGDLLSGGLTSDWVPGSIYVRKNGTYVLYLGKTKSCYLGVTWGSRYYSKGCYSIKPDLNFKNPQTTHAYFNGGLHMVVEITPRNEEEVLGWEGMNIKDLLIRLITVSHSDLMLRDMLTGTGAEYKKLLDVDEDFNVGDYIESYALSVVGNAKFSTMTDYQSYIMGFSKDLVEKTYHPEMLGVVKKSAKALVEKELIEKLKSSSDAAKSYLKKYLSDSNKNLIFDTYNASDDTYPLRSCIFPGDELIELKKTIVEELKGQHGLLETP